MLYSVDSGTLVTKVPHKAEFDRWKANISPADYQKVVDAINAAADKGEVCTAGWIPGSDWNGTVYQPLYEACGRNAEQAGLFFGLVVFETLMNRRDKTWGFGRYELNGKAIRSMTYFEVTI